jgi:hypothetical protein
MEVACCVGVVGAGAKYVPPYRRGDMRDVPEPPTVPLESLVSLESSVSEGCVPQRILPKRLKKYAISMRVMEFYFLSGKKFDYDKHDWLRQKALWKWLENGGSKQGFLKWELERSEKIRVAVLESFKRINAQ